MITRLFRPGWAGLLNIKISGKGQEMSGKTPKKKVSAAARIRQEEKRRLERAQWLSTQSLRQESRLVLDVQTALRVTA